MSFLWRNNTQTESINTCKDCTDKDKRISDYDVFFNEMKEVLKRKEDIIVELENKMEDMNKKLEEQEITIQSQTISRDKIIKEYEHSKKLYSEEKKQWFEDRAIWMETKKQLEESAMDWEVTRSRYDEQLELMNEDKSIWKKHQKVLEDKIQLLVQNLKESEEKYNDIVSRMNQVEFIKDEELQLREEIVKERYDKKFETLNDEWSKKEDEWRQREEEYEMMIHRYQDNELDYEMKIQELKYDMECELDGLDRKYKGMVDDRDEEWSNRIKYLNDTYDQEFIQFKEHFKNKEQRLEKEMQDMEFTLREEIDVLRHENIELEEAKRQLEKKRNETANKWEKRETDLISQIESLALDNQRMEIEWKESEAKRNEVERTFEEQKKISEDVQKKMEKECQTIKEELEKSQKILENTILHVIETTENKMNKETQTSEPEHIHDDSERQSIEHGLIEDNIMKHRFIKKKKHTKRKNQSGMNLSEHPYVESMKKNDDDDEKKNKEIEDTKILCGETYWTEINGHHVIDIREDHEEGHDENHGEEDSNNFFLSITGFINSLRVDKRLKEMENKLREYEVENKKLKEQNTEYLSKIQGYECNTILELNRKLRSGIPVRFYPYHSSHGLSNTSHVNSVELDLH